MPGTASNFEIRRHSRPRAFISAVPVARLMSELKPVQETSTADGVVLPDYRAVSGLAIGGLLLGLASLLAFVHPAFWVVPLAAVATCSVALRQLTREATLVGRRAALIGLAVALICGISSPIQFFIFRYQLRVEAIRTAREWFTALREDRPWAAHQWTLSPEGRWSLDDAGLVAKYAAEPDRLKSYAENPTVHLLLSLGKQCRVRLYEHVGVVSGNGGDNVLDVYSVTVNQDGRRVSFFIRMSLSRSYNLATNHWEWRIATADFIHAPPGEVGFDFNRF